MEDEALDRVAIFIDGSNFYFAMKKAFGKAQIKFDALAAKLTERVPNRRLVRVYYYNAASEQDMDSDHYKKQQRFFERLRRTPYLQLKLGRLERRPIDWGSLSIEQRQKVEKELGAPLPQHTYVEKGVDVQMSVDMLQLAVAATYDVAILISGDGDFAPAVEAVKQLGKHVELGRVRDWPCSRLRDVCDVEVLIDESLLKDCWM